MEQSKGEWVKDIQVKRGYWEAVSKRWRTQRIEAGLGNKGDAGLSSKHKFHKCLLNTYSRPATAGGCRFGLELERGMG